MFNVIMSVMCLILSLSIVVSLCLALLLSATNYAMKVLLMLVISKCKWANERSALIFTGNYKDAPLDYDKRP